jgi:tetratricopeptide (TPR) repeat protein
LDARFDVALADLDTALAAVPADYEARAWRAEALGKLGRWADALAEAGRCAAHAPADYWVGGLLHARAELNLGGLSAEAAAVRNARVLGAQPATPLDFAEEFPDVAHGVCVLAPESEPDLASADVRAVDAALARALHALGGNRTPTPTCHRVGARPDLAPAPLRSPRTAAVAALDLIKTRTVAEVRAALDAAVAASPWSVQPLCYRGEFHLWLGAYDQARQDLETALRRRARTRWAYYGLACLENVLGQPARALELCERSIAVMGSPGPPIHVYRGEAYRLLGNTRAALGELELACRLAPRRVAGHLNLALAHGDAGALGDERAGFEWVRSRVPALISDAATTLGVQDTLTATALPRDAVRALLEQALRSMCGNRASALTAWIGPTGRVRVASIAATESPPLERLQALQHEQWTTVRRLLERALRSEP